MKIEDDPLFESAMNFLENGGVLPEGASARQRFVFQAAVNRRMFREVINTKGTVDDLVKSVEAHHKTIHLYGLLKDMRFWGYGLAAFVVLNVILDVGHPFVIALVKAWTGVQLP